MKQFFYNLLSPIFYMFRYHKRINPFFTFRGFNIAQNIKLSNRSKGIVLITPIRVTPTSNVLEGLIGTFFSLKGYEVKYLMCNQILTFCENISNKNRKCITCSLCLNEQKNFLKAFSGTCIEINKYLTKQMLKDIRCLVENRSFTNSMDFIFEGIDLKDAIEAGVMRYSLKSELSIEKDLKLVKECAYNAFLLSKLLSLINDDVKLYKLITSHGIYSTWGAILETAKYKGISSIVWGRGYIGQGNLLFGHNNSIQEDLKFETKDVFKDVILTDERISLVKEYYLKKENPKANVDYVNYYVGIKGEKFDVNSFECKVKEYKTIFGMFTNIPWDGQVFNKTEAFPTTRFYLRNTIDWFVENPECLLIIRAHPAEVSRKDSLKRGETFEQLLYSEYPILPSNVIFLSPRNPITSYRLISYIDAAIMYGSSMAIELAVRKIPVIHTGFTYISNKNIVFDIIDVENLYSYLEQVKEKKLSISDEMYSNALKYGYYWIKYRNIPDTSCKLQNLEFANYNFKDQNDFLKDSFLNLFFNCVVTNKRIEKK